MENNKVFLKVLSIGSFIISAVFTIMMWQSGAVGITAKIMCTAMAIILEAAKLLLTVTAIKRKDINAGIRAVIGISAALLFFVSICASLIFLSNQGNTVGNMEKLNSESYKANQEQIKIQSELYESKKSEIAGLQAEITKLPDNYITVRGQKNDMKSEKQTELEAIAGDLKNLNNPDNIKADEGQTKGTTAFFGRISGMINDMPEYKENPVKSADIEFWFFAALAILFDTVAVILYYLASLKSQSYTDFQNNKANIPDIPLPDIINETELKRLLQKQYEKYGNAEIIDGENIKKNLGPNGRIRTFERFKIKNEIGFKPQTQELKEKKLWNDAELQTYKDYMIKNQKDNVSPGYKKISAETGLSAEKCRQIRGYLRTIGEVETQGSKTLIKKS